MLSFEENHMDFYHVYSPETQAPWISGGKLCQGILIVSHARSFTIDGSEIRLTIWGW